jgi:dihydrodipicolinate synthase/N-acetylneuraminate lyase
LIGAFLGALGLNPIFEQYGIRQIVDAYACGKTRRCIQRVPTMLPLINYENRQCGLLACKALMKEGGIIDCGAPRHPLAPLHPATRGRPDRDGTSTESAGPAMGK